MCEGAAASSSGSPDATASLVGVSLVVLRRFLGAATAASSAAADVRARWGLARSPSLMIACRNASKNRSHKTTVVSQRQENFEQHHTDLQNLCARSKRGWYLSIVVTSGVVGGEVQEPHTLGTTSSWALDRVVLDVLACLLIYTSRKADGMEPGTIGFHLQTMPIFASSSRLNNSHLSLQTSRCSAGLANGCAVALQWRSGPFHKYRESTQRA